MTKVCTKCNIPKELNEFFKDNAYKDGYDSKCKICKNKYQESRKPKTQKYLKQYFIKNKNKIAKKAKKYYLNNKDIIIEKSKAYHKKVYQRDKVKNAQRTKKWYVKNKRYCIDKANKVYKTKYHLDLEFKMKSLLRSRLYEILRKSSVPKTQSVLKLVGCILDELIKHIESQFRSPMSWENHGKIWEIDHIIPCNSFDLTNPEEQAKCFHYTNLQPLFTTTEIAESYGYKELGNRNKGGNYND